MTKRNTNLGLAAILIASTSTAALAGMENKANDNAANGQAKAEAQISADAGKTMGASGKANANANSGNMAAASANGVANGQSEGAPMTYGQLIASIQSGKAKMADVSELDDAVMVTTKTLSDMRGEAAGEAESLDVALSEIAPELNSLRTDLEANTAISAALEAEGYEPEDVIGIYTSADGGVEVLIDDRA